MLIALGTEAATKGYRVHCTLTTKLVNELVEAADEKQLNKTIAHYGRVDLLCIDELGYMELDRHGAELPRSAVRVRSTRVVTGPSAHSNASVSSNSATPRTGRQSQKEIPEV